MSNICTDPGVISVEEIKRLMSERKFIPDDVFKEVLAWLPISTADFILTRVTHRKEFLLGRRGEDPFKGTWFVPGGRLNWGESPDEACLRHLKRELGITDVTPRFVGHVSCINPPSETRPLWHSIWHLFEVPVNADIEIRPNNENKEIRWFSSIDSSWPDPVRAGLELMGFHEW